MRRFLPAVIALSLTAGACNSQLGQTIPACDPDQITNSIIITAQSVRGAAYIPCVNELQPGWEYEHLAVRRGQTRFWISSDRVGHRFLEVTFEGSCDYSGAAAAHSDEDGIPLFVRETEADFSIDVTFIPEGDDLQLEEHAAGLALDLGSDRFGDRLVKAVVDLSDDPTAARIEAALDAGRAALVVGPREYEEGTVELHYVRRGRGDTTVERGLTAEEAIEEVAGPLGAPEYRATWYYPFANGCVTYEIDAEGAGAERIASEVRDAIGFLDLGPIRQFGETVGYVVP